MKTIVKIGLISSLLVGACLSANVMAQTPSVNFSNLSHTLLNNPPTPKAPNASVTAGWTRQQKEMLTQFAQQASRIGWQSGSINNPYLGPTRPLRYYSEMPQLERTVAKSFPNLSKSSLNDVLSYLAGVRASSEGQANHLRSTTSPTLFDATTAAPDFRVNQASASVGFRTRGNFDSDMVLEEEEL